MNAFYSNQNQSINNAADQTANNATNQGVTQGEAELKIISPSLPIGELSAIMPQGVRALFLSENDTLRRSFSRFYPLDLSIIEQGRQTERKLEGSQESDITSLIAAREFEKLMPTLNLAENIRLVISEGAFIPFGKFISDRLNIKHIICGGGNLSRFEFGTGLSASDQNEASVGFGLRRHKAADAVVFDCDSVKVACGFAFVLCGYLALFDWDIAAILCGDEVETHSFNRAQKTVNKLMEAASLFGKKSGQLRLAVLEAQLEMAALINGRAGERLVVSGASQAAAALFALFKHEQRRLIDFFEMTFLLAPTVAKIYAAFLQHDITFCPPPDNNFRASRINEYLGVDEGIALNALLPYMKRHALELSDYRLGVYRTQLIRHIHNVIGMLERAYPVYFKLNDDDGFSLRGYISSLDSSLAIGLGSDILKGDTLLAYMRTKGLLDRLII